MQAQDKLKQYKNFILCNTRHDKYLSNRFCINSKYLRENQVFISLEKNIKKNFSNIKDAIEKGASGFITPFIYSRKILNKPVPYLRSVKDCNHLNKDSICLRAVSKLHPKSCFDFNCLKSMLLLLLKTP